MLGAHVACLVVWYFYDNPRQCVLDVLQAVDVFIINAARLRRNAARLRRSCRYRNYANFDTRRRWWLVGRDWLAVPCQLAWKSDQTVMALQRVWPLVWRHKYTTICNRITTGKLTLLWNFRDGAWRCRLFEHHRLHSTGIQMCSESLSSISFNSIEFTYKLWRRMLVLQVVF